MFAAVGPMQLDVATLCMASEFRAPIKLERLPIMCYASSATRSSEVLERRDGSLLAGFTDNISLCSLLRLRS